MSGLRRRYCIFDCDVTFVHGVALHRFPNPDKQPDLFAAWKSAVRDKLQTESDNSKIYKNKRICDYHFDSAQKTTGGRLIWSAVPTSNLQYVPHTISTFVDFDHNYCRPRRECQTSGPLVDITNMPTTSSQASSSTEGSLPSHSRDIPTLSQPGTTHEITSKFDSDKTRKQIHTRSTKKKERQMQTEIRRLRLKIKTFKMRLQQMQKLSAQRHFEIVTQNMSESAKLFTRMQYIEGCKKKKGRRFTLEEKNLALSIFKKSPKGYKLMTKHFTLPSKKILKSLL